MYVRQAIDLLDGLIPGGEENKDIKVDHLRKIVVLAVMWSLGALLELEDRKKVKQRKRFMFRGTFYVLLLAFNRWKISSKATTAAFPCHRHRAKTPFSNTL